MRKLCVLLALTAATSILCAGLARADEPQDKQEAKAAKDANYRYHNGQWWYWMPQQKNWKVWDGSQWNDYRPGATRSFSYADDATVRSAENATDQMFGRPLTSTPSSVSTNNQIIGSFGFRGAGSKVLGNY
jgi:hypothetical protein